jgi:hypothetical protein
VNKQDLELIPPPIPRFSLPRRKYDIVKTPDLVYNTTILLQPDHDSQAEEDV